MAKFIGDFRVHADNIVEAERTLHLIAEALGAEVSLSRGPIYAPLYEFKKDGGILCTLRFFCGHDRWGINIQEVMVSHGAPLREATDAIVTKVWNERSEEIVFAVEYCNALPAGNNAWQRTGRALTCAVVGVPYLYIADLGGAELDKARRIKAPRFPNPIIPFAYVIAGREYSSPCLPVYFPSPSSSEQIRTEFAQAFGYVEELQMVRLLLEGSFNVAAEKGLLEKALLVVDILAGKRKRVDTLRGSQWKELLEIRSAKDKAKWLEQLGKKWVKKSGDKVRVTKTFKRLISNISDYGCISVGANEIPICLIPAARRKDLTKFVSKLYGKHAKGEFFEWLSSVDLPLAVVWITGFKPEGEDSRPDRGLVPLARMLFGKEIDVLSVVSGPGKKKMWVELQQSYKRLAEVNGLWEAIVNLSDGMLVDSATARENPSFIKIDRRYGSSKEKIRFGGARLTPDFSEQDVDSVLHLLFTATAHPEIFECMCNPPGGDWSGLSILDFQTGSEYRWTSLPRVSASKGKRPDHAIQIRRSSSEYLLVSLESKTRGEDIHSEIGARLNRYTKDLVKTGPTIHRTNKGEWSIATRKSGFVSSVTFLSGGAFCWSGKSNLEASFQRGNFDLVFALEFHPGEEKTVLHLKARDSAAPVVKTIHELCDQLSRWLVIQVH